MSKTNLDGSLDERFKGNKSRNSKRRLTAFIIGIIAAVVFYVAALITGVGGDPDTDIIPAVIIGAVVGLISNVIMKKINKLRG